MSPKNRERRPSTEKDPRPRRVCGAAGLRTGCGEMGGRPAGPPASTPTRQDHVEMPPSPGVLAVRVRPPSRKQKDLVVDPSIFRVI
jgi:hypothetical protein